MAATSVLTGAAQRGVALDDFEAVVAMYWTPVFRFALVSMRDPDLAGTIAQDCFLKAYRGRDRFRGECSIRTWLMRITVNLVRDAIRSRRLQFWRRSSNDVAALADVVADGSGSPEAAAMAKERLETVWKIVDALPRRQRTVFLLRFVEEMDLRDIATVTGIAEGTVKVHLFRALQTVRERSRSKK